MIILRRVYIIGYKIIILEVHVISYNEIDVIFITLFYFIP